MKPSKEEIANVNEFLDKAYTDICCADSILVHTDIDKYTNGNFITILSLIKEISQILEDNK